MTKTEFNTLEPFNEEKFKNGEKVVALYGGEPTFPDSQKYYEGHPEPIVLTVDGKDFSYNPEYAKNVVRMIAKDRYVPKLEYTDRLDLGVVWMVWDTYEKKKMANFLSASEEAKEFAEEYAQFLNDAEKALKEKEFDAYKNLYTYNYHYADLKTVPYTITQTEVPF